MRLINPATEETIGSVEATTLEAADQAIARAQAAYPRWREVTPADRSAGSSSPASAANSAGTRSMPSPRPRTFS